MDDIILMISPFFSPNIGGVETHLDDLCAYLNKRKRRVRVITYQPLTTIAKGRKIEDRETVRIRRIRWFGHNLFHRLESRPLLEFLYLAPGLFLFSLFFLLRNRKIVRVIHAHGLVAAFIAIFLAQAFGKRSIVSLHTIYRFGEGLKASFIIRKVLSRTDHFLVVSQKCKEDLLNMGVSESKVSVFRYWVDHDVFKPLNREKSKQIIGFPNKFIALFVGRFIEAKGVELVVQAAAMARNEITFLFVGNGPLEGKIRKQAEKHNNILIISGIKNKELPIYYSAANVLVWGPIDQDYLGRVSIEALSCELPVIVPNRVAILGVAEDVLPGVLDSSVGILLAPNAKLLAEKLDELYSSSVRLENLRTRCREFAFDRYGVANARAIEKTYDLVAQREA